MAESVYKPKDEIDSEGVEMLMLVTRRDSDGYGGWRRELLVDWFLGEVEGKFLLCSYCREILRDACLIEKDGKQELACSVCIPKGRKSQIASMSRETVDAKQVFCPLKSKGCFWKGELGQLLHHLEGCGFFPIPCPLECRNESGKMHKVERMHVERHKTYCPMRTVKCEYCIHQIQSCLINAHLESCDGFPVNCPNNCSETLILKREDVSTHLNEHCLLNTMHCPYSQYGCKIKKRRLEMDEHEKEDIHKHFKLTMLNNIKTQNKVEELEEENMKLKERIFTLESKSKSDTFSLELKYSFQWNISNIKSKVSHKRDLFSEAFYVGLYRFKCCIDWNHKPSEMGYFFFIMKGEWDSTLKWPLRYKYTVELVNQIDPKCNFQKCIVVSKEIMKDTCFKRPKKEMNDGFGFDNSITHADLFTKYCKENSLMLKISVELLDS